jgi:hypothetical protein
MPWPGHGDVIAIEDGEHKNNQDPECMHKHVLFVVSDVKCTMINSEWRCSGGVRRFLPNWQIASSDLAEQPKVALRGAADKAGRDCRRTVTGR